MTSSREDARVAVSAASMTSVETTVNLTKDAQLEQVRTMLVGPEQAELADLRARIVELETLVPRLALLEDVIVEQFELATERLDRVEATLLATEGRASAVAEVLVDAVSATDREPGTLGQALAPEVEHAVHASARLDSTVLAEALYPVMGPALRKMIAEVFSLNGTSKGSTFAVQQVLVIERHAGLLLLSRAADGSVGEESIVVSGMLDAIQHFVQDAFGAATHDGLQDLRVGDTSVLVEWGPRAALASVVTGIPSPTYRGQAAEALETFHDAYRGELDAFDGDNALFAQAGEHFAPLFEGRGLTTASSKTIWPAVTAIFVAVLLLAALFMVL